MLRRNPDVLDLRPFPSVLSHVSMELGQSWLQQWGVLGRAPWERPL